MFEPSRPGNAKPSRRERVAKMGALSLTPATESPAAAADWPGTAPFDEWRSSVRNGVLALLCDFVEPRRSQLDDTRVDAAGDILMAFASGGKCLRSTFMYLGWLCGAAPDRAALRAAASFELLHVFALLQDDVMDGSAERRGRPSAHLQFSQWHRARGLSGSSARFGESAAILLGDLCLIWSEQMLRESGVDARRLQRAWPRYDTMRTELALGQFADLVSDVRRMPTLDAVLDVARRKSGNYTVRRPLEIGAAMSDCDDRTLSRLGRYGAAIGEAFQLRDDVLGVFGSPAITGKPAAGDLLERKATSLVVTAHQLADASTRAELTELMNGHALDGEALDRCKTLIVGTGAVQLIEQMISDRVAAAREHLDDASIDGPVRTALEEMATACTDRAE
ncbi:MULTISPECIES: polyprenyl synthetase family protein [unclassified Mycobacterium]|uniref:polyprenyl synthetase family protein n=1 Tax=unclassified Mycobacterium TaxID=2642494 RepID=UPI0007FE6102|nr:polyprenyl synthetase [Mycobacterium sp. E188]OBG79048.1 polyprenyl synthetase [Mycobacterium sp. E3305]OBH36169.1 polyprenyl synthetase [Mycobacterium sp. E183]